MRLQCSTEASAASLASGADKRCVVMMPCALTDVAAATAATDSAPAAMNLRIKFTVSLPGWLSA
jgi:hypothetical protein